jgi:hypothetical protein
MEPSNISQRNYQFIGLVNHPIYWTIILILLLLDLAIYYLPPWKLQETKTVNIELDKLKDEKRRIENIITDKCNSNDLMLYKNGQAGPITGFPDADIISKGGDNNQQLNEPDVSNSRDLVELLKGATVRVWSGDMIGSGFFINDHQVVTNRHVIENSAGRDLYITNKAIGESPIPVQLIDTSETSNIANPDFALLGVKDNYKSKYMLSISDTPTQLEPVIAAGFPGLTTELDKSKVTPSVVFSRGEVNVIQEQPNGVVLVIHNADIARGSSGGPLVNKCGSVVGVNTFINGGEAVDGRSLYALSASTLKKFLISSGQKYVERTENCSSDDKK